MTKSKHTVIYYKTRWDIILACMCPQILGIVSTRQFRKHSRIPQTCRLVWSSKPVQDIQSRQRHHINPHYKEVA